MLMLMYFIAFPIILLISLVFIIFEKKEIIMLNTFRENKRGNLNEIRKKVSRLKKMGMAFFVIFLLFLPVWNYTASIVCDDNLHREMYGGMTIKGSAYSVRDPVIYSIDPTMDIENVMKKMDERPMTYLPDDLKDHIDFDKLTMFPGRLAVYRLYGERLIVTYSYFAPYPLIKAYGFLVENPDSDDPSLTPIGEEMIMYPMNPSVAGRVAT